MLRLAKPTWRSNLALNSTRKFSSKPPTSNVPQPTLKSKPVEEDGGFRGKFASFMLFQGVVLAFLGVAHKMEDDKKFAAKIEGYYETPGVKPTMETFRSIVRFIQPPIKKIDIPKPKTMVETVHKERQPEQSDLSNVIPDHVVEETVVTEIHPIEKHEPIVESVIPPLDKETVAIALEIVDKIDHIEHQVNEKKAEIAKVVHPVVEVTPTPAVVHTPVEVQTETPKPEKVVLPSVSAEARAKEVKANSGELELENMTRSASKTRHDLQASLLQDLHELDEAELRKRIMQLAAEFFERTKWEGLRLHEALKHLEDELISKYTAVIDEQRSQLQVELDRALMQREKEIVHKMTLEKEELIKHQDEVLANAIQAQASGFHLSQLKQLEEETEKLRRLFEDEYNLKVAVMKHQQVQQLEAIHVKIDGVRANVESYAQIADDIRSNQLKSKALHAQSAVILALDNVLTGSKPLSPIIGQLKQMSKDNVLVNAALDSISSYYVKNGIPTTPELRNRFKVVRKEVRKASLIPEFAPNFLGHAIGSALAKISWTPAVDAKIDTHNPDLEDRLASIGYYLEMNDLHNAISECKHIDGYPRLLMQDWENSVKQRIAAEQALTILKSELALKHKQMADI